ncbi:MAG: hypothetical protein O3A46_03245 [Candidatus Poribacteria bacterium]|nr:hypothetical protein [Candidatus Poribacteria bacterium]
MLERLFDQFASFVPILVMAWFVQRRFRDKKRRERQTEVDDASPMIDEMFDVVEWEDEPTPAVAPYEAPKPIPPSKPSAPPRRNEGTVPNVSIEPRERPKRKRMIEFNPKTARQAVLMAEVLGKPKSLQ